MIEMGVNMSSYRILTHIHTKFSHDSILPFFLLYNKCLKSGIQYIAITEHNNIQGAREFQKYCEERGNKLKVILGEEIMTTGGEIIGLYICDNIPAGLSPAQTVKMIQEQGGVVYIPHPYDEKRHKTVLKEKYISELKSQIDCIECHNGRNISGYYDIKQNQIAERYGLLKVIGADAHTYFELGRNYMEMEYPPDNKDHFLKALHSVSLFPCCCLTYCHRLTQIDRIIKFLLKGDFRGLFRTVIRKFTY